MRSTRHLSATESWALLLLHRPTPARLLNKADFAGFDHLATATEVNGTADDDSDLVRNRIEMDGNRTRSISSGLHRNQTLSRVSVATTNHL